MPHIAASFSLSGQPLFPLIKACTEFDESGRFPVTRIDFSHSRKLRHHHPVHILSTQFTKHDMNPTLSSRPPDNLPASIKPRPFSPLQTHYRTENTALSRKPLSLLLSHIIGNGKSRSVILGICLCTAAGIAQAEYMAEGTYHAAVTGSGHSIWNGTGTEQTFNFNQGATLDNPDWAYRRSMLTGNCTSTSGTTRHSTSIPQTLTNRSTSEPPANWTFQTVISTSATLLKETTNPLS